MWVLAGKEEQACAAQKEARGLGVGSLVAGTLAADLLLASRGPARAVTWSSLLSPTACPPSSEIEALKLAEQERRAQQRRKATVVVGDLQPLRDALPELLELEAGGRRQRTRG